MDSTALKGELLYEYTAHFTNIVEYGTPLAAVLSGQAPIPPAGARFDIAFAGDVQGQLAGRLEAIDYLNVRADGRMDLDLRGTLTTPEGARIAFAAGGVCLPAPGSTEALLRENVRLSTAHADYAWLGTREIWAIGYADLAASRVFLRGYLPA
jgi:hypothetical protein